MASQSNEKHERLLRRRREIIAKSDAFDRDYYLKQTEDPKAAKDPIDHYLRQGATAGLNPWRGFDTGYYRRVYLNNARQPNALVHYLKEGEKQGFQPTAEIADWDSRKLPAENYPSPGPRKKPIYVLPATHHERSTVRYRVDNLIELLGGESVTRIDIRHLPRGFWKAIEAGAILVVQRIMFQTRTIDFLRRVRTTPTVIVYDIDDQIFDLNELEDWRSADLPPPKLHADCMVFADMFLVSTYELRAKIERSFQRPAYVIQNGLSLEVVAKSEAARHQPKPETFVVGYAAGTPSHHVDLQAALPGIDAFLSANPEVEFHCIGWVTLPPEFLEKFGRRVVLSDPVSWRDLPAALAMHTVHIVPLADCTFNSYKSHIRHLEAVAVGVPTIGSTVGEHAKTIVNGVTGLVCDNTPESWCQALQALYDSQDLRERIVQASRDIVFRYHTTQAPLLKHRLHRALDDFEAGVMRDSISLLIAAEGSTETVSQTIEAVLSTTTVPFEVLIWNRSPDPQVKDYLEALEHPNVILFDFQDDLRKAAAIDHMAKVATGRYICELNDGFVLPDHWDLQMIQAARAIPNLGWLSTNVVGSRPVADRRCPIDSFPGGVSILSPPKVGDWVVFTTASARRKMGGRDARNSAGEQVDYNDLARQMGLYTGHVRRVAGRWVAKPSRFPWRFGSRK